jgi:formate hydrogenlyase transcriptional activator
VGSIEGHRASWIALLDEGRTSYLRYDRPGDYHGDAGEPVRRPVAGSVLARLLDLGRTHESGDLATEPEFADDRELLAQGVRRYVATPLTTGGKLLGAFLFGSGDAHPPLRIDVWLLENIAVQLALALHNAQHHEELARLSARREQQNVYLREELRSERDALGMLGESPALARLRERIARVAATEATVLVSGPTGVGKELVARALHEASPRREQPLVKLNCAAIPEGMVESELFGHERGAFTSAVERRIGRFELAHNGTLFLDEVGELSPAVQAKLLRVLQSGEFERVGGTKTLTSNARIVAATNRDLARGLASGTFRADLYYRLNVFPIEVPPLAERRTDVALLARAFVEHFARRMGKRFEELDPASLAQLSAREWPGNVRELKHFVERAVILCDGPVFRLEGERAAEHATVPAAARREVATLEEVEAAHIRATLERASWVVEGARGAAALLDLKASTLRFRMKRLGIRRPEHE